MGQAYEIAKLVKITPIFFCGLTVHITTLHCIPLQCIPLHFLYHTIL